MEAGMSKSDSQEKLIERAQAWCLTGRWTDQEMVDRSFARSLVADSSLFAAFRAGQRDRDAEIAERETTIRKQAEEVDRLRELMASAVDDFHGKAVLFSSEFLLSAQANDRGEIREIPGGAR